ncbi:glycosyltransferase [Qipengyuania atrilutea]|uniref:Glycosyltransferase family 4 protein n=1 Tax=Qipengyuania atrilutea TaxID=2744473 RepID=A0A850H6X2_9SPHN|nr:glycosyltransferase [Actirhodobacter atriluteus]NVD45553.1 glycosyltransferase family 4 protein [Actirhodobacter atriluteus]
MERAGGRDGGKVAILFAQFAPYHVDRIAAAAERLAGRAEVIGIEVADSSATYGWERAGGVAGARKVTLFPEQRYEDIGSAVKLRRALRTLQEANTVFVGIPYSESWIMALTAVLRLRGCRVILMTESKADDFPRKAWLEMLKRAVLAPYDCALVGGERQAHYIRHLGFRTRPVLEGYDTIGNERVRALVTGKRQPQWRERPFLYVGRFVEKKNLAVLLEAFALYRKGAGPDARRLVMAGDGPLGGELQNLAKRLGVAKSIDWPGFLGAAGVAEAMHDALALSLVSTTEQWGLVLNEAAALGLPVIVSPNVGACDRLVRDGETGRIVATTDPTAIANAMRNLAKSEAQWVAMRAASLAISEAGDVRHFADAVEKLIAPTKTAS